MLNKLSRKLHCITSTLTTQETLSSMGSNNVFRGTGGDIFKSPGGENVAGTSSTDCRSHSIALASARNRTQPSNDRSTPSLWYESIKSPLKASKKLFRDMMAEMQDKSLSFSFSTKTNRTPKMSDAEDLRLKDHGYSFPRTSSSATLKSKLEQKVSSDFDSDDAFLPNKVPSDSGIDTSKIRQASWQKRRAPSITISAQRLLCKSCSTGDLNFKSSKVDTVTMEHKIMFNNFIAEN